MADVPSIQAGRRLGGEERASAGVELLRRYDAGTSIRELCAETGYSIGRVRRLLQEAGVTYRTRGGGHRKMIRSRNEEPAEN